MRIWPYVLTEHGIYTREREEEILRTNWVHPRFKDLWINMFYMYTRCAYRYAARVTALFSRASLIQQEIGCDPKKCAVVPNGVDYEKFSAIPPKRPGGSVDIGAVVRLVPIKDIKTMLYAFAMVSQVRSDVRLHIMGPTEEDEAYYEECRRLKEDLGLKNVVFTGRVDVRSYLEKIDFTLLTSISEGQPLAVLEAMAAGRPAVTTDVGSCRELIMGPGDDFGPAGICVPVMHQTALAEAILSLCRDANARARILITLPANVHFVVSVEVNFYRKYRRYFDAILGGGTLKQIIAAREGMTASLKQEVSMLAKLQTTAMLAYAVFMRYYLQTIGFTTDMIAMFQVMTIGYSAYAIGNCLMLIQLYFNDLKGAMMVAAAFFVVNVLVTALTLGGPPFFYGLGLVAAGIAMYIVSMTRLFLYVRRIDCHVFCGQPLLAPKGMSVWSKAASRLNARADSLADEKGLDAEVWP